MRVSKGVAATAAAVLLAGCQTLNSVAGVVTGSDEGKGAEPGAAGVTSPAAVAASPAAPAATSLSGMSADTLRSLWGEPTLKRNEGEAQLWQYGGTGNCTLLVYLYPGGTALTVTHAEAVPGGADDAAVEACAKAAGKPSLKPVS